MKIGIVGAEGAKFTKLGEERAKTIILDLLRPLVGQDYPAVVSGHCHLGGIDIWAEELADMLGIRKHIYPPRAQNWNGGYRPRNIQIAKNSDIVYCIAVDKLPPDFKGMKFDSCYHCAKHGQDDKNHVKSGGCWTMYYAMHLHRQGKLIVVENY